MSWVRKENATNCDRASIRVYNCLKGKSEYIYIYIYIFFLEKKIMSDNRI